MNPSTILHLAAGKSGEVSRTTHDDLSFGRLTGAAAAAGPTVTANGIHSKIAGYIRAEIPAAVLINNANKMAEHLHMGVGRAAPPVASTAPGSTFTTSMAAPPGFRGGAARKSATTNRSRSKVRPPFRNTINIKNTSSLSFVTVSKDMKRLRIEETRVSSSRKTVTTVSVAGSNTTSTTNKVTTTTTTSKTTNQAKLPVDKNDPASLLSEAGAGNVARNSYAMSLASKAVPAAGLVGVRKKPTGPVAAAVGAVSSCIVNRGIDLEGSGGHHMGRAKRANFVPAPLLRHVNLHVAAGQCMCLEDPEVESVCICRSDAYRKIILENEAGSYMQTLRQKLVSMQNKRMQQTNPVAGECSPASIYQSTQGDQSDQTDHWQPCL